MSSDLHFLGIKRIRNLERTYWKFTLTIFLIELCAPTHWTCKLHGWFEKCHPSFLWLWYRLKVWNVVLCKWHWLVFDLNSTYYQIFPIHQHSLCRHHLAFYFNLYPSFLRILFMWIKRVKTHRGSDLGNHCRRYCLGVDRCYLY